MQRPFGIGIRPHITGASPKQALDRGRRVHAECERQLRLEREIHRILSDGEGPEVALVAVLRTVVEALGLKAGQFLRLDETDGVLRIHAAWSADDERLRKILLQDLQQADKPGEGLAGEVLRTGRPLWVRDLRTDSRVLSQGLAAETGWHSTLLLPVLAHNRVIGVIAFYAAAIPQPDKPLLDFIQLLGNQVGSFYARALTLNHLSERESRYSTMVELAAVGISQVDVDGRFVHVNRRLCEMLGYTSSELLQLNFRQVTHSDDRSCTDKDLSRLAAGEIDSFRAEKRYLRKDGSEIWVNVTVATKRDSRGHRLQDIAIIEDITERKEAQSRIQYLATHDEMTGLANRVLFNELLTRAVAQASRGDQRLAVLFIDLDRFKIINDSLGHECGDQLLKEISSRFASHVRASDVLARLGGDEFVLAIHDLKDRQAAAIVARQLLHVVLKPVLIAGHECRVTASIGIAYYPDDAQDAASLMKHADIAMYRAKEEGKNNCQFYSASIGAVSENRLRIETGLRDALVRNELSLHYQPKLDIQTGEIRGVEALLRWTHPELGVVSPARFIPVAEESGLIVPIGYWAMAAACAQTAAWLREGLPAISMAVNLSPRQFMDENLVPTIAGVLKTTGIPPELLELEVTESMVVHDSDVAAAKLTAIREMGVRLAIDDFGTGYSSLAQLKRFPIDVLKIDRSFIKGIPTDKDDMAITEAILTLGKALGVTIVAEGVETAEQQAFLKHHACQEMQGYHFSRPVPPDEFAKFYLAHALTRA